MSSVLVRVQHHPSRAALLGRLVPGFGHLPVEVIEHSSTPPSPWAGYRLCLSDIPPEYNHVLVVQDDALPAVSLPRAVEQIAASSRAADPIVMYHGRMPVLTRRNATRSMTVGERFTEVHSRDYVPCVAMLWPVKHAQDLLDWWARQPRTRPDRADDGIIGRWRRARRHTIHATVPSLFEHPDDVPSTIKLRNYERRALFFAEDASRYDWS